MTVRPVRFFFCFAFSVMFAVAGAVAGQAAELRAHGGPVRALAIAPDGAWAVSGGFDSSVVLWDLATETATSIRRVHQAPVTAIAILDGDRFVSAGDDGSVLEWSRTHVQPTARTEATGNPVVGLAAVAGVVVTIGADRTVRAAGRDSAAGAPLAELREMPVALARSVDGRVIVATATGSLLAFPAGDGLAASDGLAAGPPVSLAELPTVPTTLAVAADGDVLAGGADGRLYVRRADGSERRTIEVQNLPITSLALSPDGTLVAAAGLRGAVTILERSTGAPVSTLVGPGLPVWSLAFQPDNLTIRTGGSDGVIRRWNARTGQPEVPPTAPRPDFPRGEGNERGAQVFRACQACHSVTPDGGNRAGPTLHGVFGRRIASLPGYVFSEPLTRLEIVWSAETISRLFELGPSTVTPGTKMPEQTIGDPEDRKALVEWLERVTR